jgi:hypothetical protein
VNGKLPPGTYRFALAEDRMTISFLQGISKLCFGFDKRQFEGVMATKFSKLSSYIAGYDDAAQQSAPRHQGDSTGGFPK